MSSWLHVWRIWTRTSFNITTPLKRGSCCKTSFFWKMVQYPGLLFWSTQRALALDTSGRWTSKLSRSTVCTHRYACLLSTTDMLNRRYKYTTTKYTCSQRSSLSSYIYLSRAVLVLRQLDASFTLHGPLKSRATQCEFRSRSSGTEIGFTLSFFSFFLLIIILSECHIHLNSCYRSDDIR